jgi:hypothetical protein
MERKDKEQLKRRLQVLFFCVEKVISLTQETNLLWGSFSSCILTGVKWVIEEGKLDMQLEIMVNRKTNFPKHLLLFNVHQAVFRLYTGREQVQ